jgi:hypothetical protein
MLYCTLGNDAFRGGGEFPGGYFTERTRSPLILCHRAEMSFISCKNVVVPRRRRTDRDLSTKYLL